MWWCSTYRIMFHYVVEYNWRAPCTAGVCLVAVALSILEIKTNNKYAMTVINNWQWIKMMQMNLLKACCIEVNGTNHEKWFKFKQCNNESGEQFCAIEKRSERQSRAENKALPAVDSIEWEARLGQYPSK